MSRPLNMFRGGYQVGSGAPGNQGNHSAANPY